MNNIPEITMIGSEYQDEFERMSSSDEHKSGRSGAPQIAANAGDRSNNSLSRASSSALSYSAVD